MVEQIVLLLRKTIPATRKVSSELFLTLRRVKTECIRRPTNEKDDQLTMLSFFPFAAKNGETGPFHHICETARARGHQRALERTFPCVGTQHSKVVQKCLEDIGMQHSKLWNTVIEASLTVRELKRLPSWVECLYRD